MLVRTDALLDATADATAEHLDDLAGLRRIVVLGGPGAVSCAATTQLEALLD